MQRFIGKECVSLRTHLLADSLTTSLSVEFAHEMLNLPKPPQVLIYDLPNNWYSDKRSFYEGVDEKERFGDLPVSSGEKDDFSEFETSFRSFLYGGVSVQRISPRQLDGGGVEFVERRILWLMLPAIGSLQLGYLSKQWNENSDMQSDISHTGTQFSDDQTTGDYSADDITTDSRRSMTVSYFLKT